MPYSISLEHTNKESVIKSPKCEKKERKQTKQIEIGLKLRKWTMTAEICMHVENVTVSMTQAKEI